MVTLLCSDIDEVGDGVYSCLQTITAASVREAPANTWSVPEQFANVRVVYFDFYRKIGKGKNKK